MLKNKIIICAGIAVCALLVNLGNPLTTKSDTKTTKPTNDSSTKHRNFIQIQNNQIYKPPIQEIQPQDTIKINKDKTQEIETNIAPDDNSDKEISVPDSTEPTESESDTKNQETESPKIRAFLDTIAWAEVDDIDAIGYQALVFNGKFTSFATHPKIKQCAPINDRTTCSTAAGRYQVMDYEWDRLAPILGLKDFSPQSQDAIALELIREKGAIEDIENDQFEEAACKVGTVWASFPCNNYNQNAKSMEELKEVYEQLKENYESPNYQQPPSS